MKLISKIIVDRERDDAHGGGLHASVACPFLLVQVSLQQPARRKTVRMTGIGVVPTDHAMLYRSSASFKFVTTVVSKEKCHVTGNVWFGTKRARRHEVVCVRLNDNATLEPDSLASSEVSHEIMGGLTVLSPFFFGFSLCFAQELVAAPTAPAGDEALEGQVARNIGVVLPLEEPKAEALPNVLL